MYLLYCCYEKLLTCHLVRFPTAPLIHTSKSTTEIPCKNEVTEDISIPSYSFNIIMIFS